VELVVSTEFLLPPPPPHATKPNAAIMVIKRMVDTMKISL
jgi:hypothetical protein